MQNIIRASSRKAEQIRDLTIDINYIKNAYSSCLIKFGDTHVICTASISDRVPYFLKNSASGWLTAEYGMLPASTNSRIEREITKGKANGRSTEIQRLIGRSLRACLNLKFLPEVQIIIDCDVIQADGGTRCASITGGFVALNIAIKRMLKERLIYKDPIIHSVCAISCGIYKNNVIADLDYMEDSNADVDSNFILTGNNKLVEIQATAEKESFSEQEFIQMLNLAKEAATYITLIQKSAIDSYHA